MTKTQANEPGFVLVTDAMVSAAMASWFEDDWQNGRLIGVSGAIHENAEKEMRAVIAAAFSAAPIVPAPAYGVKALEWTNIGRCVGWTAEDERTHLYHAQSLDRLYEVARGKVGWWAKWQGAFHAQELPTLDEAKAACQADFERRILSCLSSAPVEEADAKAGEPNRDIIRSIQEGFAVAFTPPASPIPSEPEAKGEAGAGPVGEAVAWCETLAEHLAERHKHAMLDREREAFHAAQSGDKARQSIASTEGERHRAVYHSMCLIIADEQKQTGRIPRAENCGRYLAQGKEGQWFFLNHANTWQPYQGPQEAHAETAEAALAETRERLEREAPQWRPIEERDRIIETIQTFGDVTLRNSHPVWVRDADGRVYEAVWTVDDKGRGYWWDTEGESPADPVDILPHPLTELAALSTQESSAALAGDGKEVA